MIELHGFVMSPNTRRARFALEETGVSYTFHDVDLMAGAHKEPAYPLLNPTARVPALVHRDEKNGDYTLWERCLAPLDAALTGKTWLAGDRFTIADISVMPSLAYASMLQIDLARFPNVASWVERVAAREAWKRVSS